MTNILILLAIGHVLGDFYLQWDKMANAKNESLRWLAGHGVLYSACVAGVMLASFEFSLKLLWILLIVSITHFAIDFFKKYIKWKTFTVDQLLHILVLLAVWRMWGGHIQTREYIENIANYLPIALGLLIIIRPVGLLIDRGDIWDFNNSGLQPTKGSVDEKNARDASMMIGYLERIIAFFLLLFGQFAAIAFIIAAKSIARFPEIKNSNENLQANYYIIGTLLSLTSVFATMLPLGLINIS